MTGEPARLFREGDVVRIVALRESAAQHLLVPNALRAPRLGDVGTVIEVMQWPGEIRYAVESDDGDGEIVWLAAFVEEEMELEAKFERTAHQGDA